MRLEVNKDFKEKEAGHLEEEVSLSRRTARPGGGPLRPHTLQVRGTQGPLPAGRPSGRLLEACCYSGLRVGLQQAPPYLSQQVSPALAIGETQEPKKCYQA